MVYILLALGLVLLAVGGDVLVSGAVSVARRLGVSTLLIGLTLVGFGTSTPELVTSLLAAVQGANGIAVGNAVGSNIANILLVLGLASLIRPVSVDVTAFKRDGVFLGISSVALIIGAFWGTIGFVMGLIFVGVLIFYIYYSYITDKKHCADVKENETNDNKTSVVKALLKTVGGIALTMLGAKLLVDNAIILARNWGISEAVIGLSIVAVGTSLPELATSVMSAIKKESNVAFGNVVGSNIYNALFILGVTALIIPLSVTKTMAIDILIMTAVTILLSVFAVFKKGFSRPVGGLFLILYAGYMWYLF